MAQWCRLLLSRETFYWNSHAGPAPLIIANLTSRRYHENRRPPFQQAWRSSNPTWYCQATKEWYMILIMRPQQTPQLRSSESAFQLVYLSFGSWGYTAKEVPWESKAAIWEDPLALNHSDHSSMWILIAPCWQWCRYHEHHGRVLSGL